jgi:hypothetical protein
MLRTILIDIFARVLDLQLVLVVILATFAGTAWVLRASLIEGNIVLSILGSFVGFGIGLAVASVLLGIAFVFINPRVDMVFHGLRPAMGH